MELERLYIVLISSFVLLIGIIIMSKFVKNENLSIESKNKEEESIRYFLEEYVEKKLY